MLTVNKKPDIYGRMYNTRLCCEALFFTAYTEAYRVLHYLNSTTMQSVAPSDRAEIRTRIFRLFFGPVQNS